MKDRGIQELWSRGARAGLTADRWIFLLEALVGLGVVFAIIGRTYGAVPTFVFLICSLFAAFTGYLLFKMLGALRDQTLDVSGRVRDLERERLEHEKYLLLRGIKELEGDAATGKVDRRDYEHLRRSAEARAMEIIAALSESEERWLGSARRIVAERLSRAPRSDVAMQTGLRCATCGAENESDARYCIGCGRPRATGIAEEAAP